MKPAPFDYLAPTRIEEVLDVLREYGDEAKVLAGGQSLVPMLNFRLARPAVLVDINQVAGLDGIRAEDGTLRIGAMSRQRALERHLSSGPPTVRRTLLREALGYIGHPQIRARGTVGGSLAHADPAAELPAAVSALGATLVIRSADGSREVAPEDFFEGFFTTSLAAEELLTEIRVPAWPEGTRSCLPRGQPPPRRLRAGRGRRGGDRGRRPDHPGRARRRRGRTEHRAGAQRRRRPGRFRARRERHRRARRELRGRPRPAAGHATARRSTGATWPGTCCSGRSPRRPGSPDPVRPRPPDP